MTCINMYKFSMKFFNCIVQNVAGKDINSFQELYTYIQLAYCWDKSLHSFIAWKHSSYSNIGKVNINAIHPIHQYTCFLLFSYYVVMV